MSRNRWIALTVALGAAVALALAGLTANLDWGPAHWGDVSTWIAAISTGGALIAGVLVLNLQRQDLNERETEHKAEAEDRRREQARHISQWLARWDEGDGRLRVVVGYQNSSPEPVYEATIYVKTTWDGGPSIFQFRIGGIRPNKSDGQATVPVDNTMSGLAAENKEPPIIITFRDAVGRWWKRNEHGVLEQWPHRPDVMPEQTPAPDPD